MLFESKDPEARTFVQIDFADRLVPGEALLGPPVVRIGAYMCVDSAAAVAAMLDGDARLDGATSVYVPVAGGRNGLAYFLEATCPTSAGRVLCVGGVMQVVECYVTA